MAGKETAHVPFGIERFVARHLLIRLVRFVGHRVLTVRTLIGRKVRPMMMANAAPLVRVKPKDLLGRLRRVGRIARVQDGKPVTEEGDVLDVASVMRCTGYLPGFLWIHLPILGDRQEPIHERGVAEREPGLYFIGLRRPRTRSLGVQRDAKRGCQAPRPLQARGTGRRGRASWGRRDRRVAPRRLRSRRREADPLASPRGARV